MVVRTGCQCFTCRHSDEPRLVTAYSVGYIEACKQFLNWAKTNNIQRGSLTDNDIGGLYAQIQCNYEETLCIMNDLPDIED